MLHDVNFEIAPGTRVGIAGQTGAGKTTLVNLLTRFYDPVDGQILLDDVDLRDYKLRDLRSQFAIVLQEPVLFSTSIGENIAYARPGASVDEIVAAAQAASAHDFITALPDGYDTRVGERGLRLSGGERQRISLARAFLTDAPILDPGRADQFGGPPNRRGDHAGHESPDGRPDHVHHRASAEHVGAVRREAGPRPRPDREHGSALAQPGARLVPCTVMTDPTSSHRRHRPDRPASVARRRRLGLRAVRRGSSPARP